MALILKRLEEGKLTLKNRLVLPPMATAKCSEDGSLSKDILDYYDEKSKGGNLALVIIEHSFITQQGRFRERQPSIAEDTFIDGLSELAEIIHNNGSKAVMQINHAGALAKQEVTGLDVVGPKELTNEEISKIVTEFANAARRVKAAGFDGVEIHSAHGYLLNQFFSPLSNKRTDMYGGDVLGRIRIHLEVIKAVRLAVGEDFPILLRLGACDYTEGGSTIEDSKIAAKEFEKAGIDILDISGGLCGYVKPGELGQGYFSSLTEEIKKDVSVPVILTGGITEIQAAEQLLSEGKADLIGVGRAILKDSSWAEKAILSLT